MLTRENADTFNADTASTVTLVVDSDDGAPSATFRYAGQPLPKKTIGGDPGCAFDVVSGTKMFSTAVVFGQGNAPRYDLFEVDGNGLRQPLNVSLTPTTTGPTIQLRIKGLAVPALAAAPRARAEPKATKKAKGKKKGGTRRPKAGSRRKKAPAPRRSARRGRGNR